MKDGAITEDVRRFLFEQIENYEELEALLLLYRSRSGVLTREAAATELRIGIDAAVAALEALCQKKLARAQGTDSFEYGGEPAVDRLVNDLARAYELRQLDVIKEMNANAMTKIRTTAIRTFANAF